jgi:hypothetical protein
MFCGYIEMRDIMPILVETTKCRVQVTISFLFSRNEWVDKNQDGSYKRTWRGDACANAFMRS